MLTITTANTNNTSAKISFLTKPTNSDSKVWTSRHTINLPAGTPPQKLDEIYQSLLNDDIDLYNPHLNVRDAYIRHVEQQNADIKTQINDLQELLSQADRVILALLASLLVFAVIAVAMVWR